MAVQPRQLRLCRSYFDRRISVGLRNDPVQVAVHDRWIVIYSVVTSDARDGVRDLDAPVPIGSTRYACIRCRHNPFAMRRRVGGSHDKPAFALQ